MHVDGHDTLIHLKHIIMDKAAMHRQRSLAILFSLGEHYAHQEFRNQARAEVFRSDKQSC